MNFKKLLIASLLWLTGVTSLFAEERILIGSQADAIVQGAVKVRFTDKTVVPDFIQFAPGKGLLVALGIDWMMEHFKLSTNYGFALLEKSDDKIGFTHYRYQQTYMGYPVEGSMYLLHVRAGIVETMNGVIYNNIALANATISEPVALQNALGKVNANLYKWQVPSQEEHLKIEQNDPNATYLPKGVLTVVKDGNAFHLCYAFNIYAQQPLSRTMQFVDASTGQVIYTKDLIRTANTPATAVTGYSGSKTIMTDSFGGSYRLRETGRGNGIQTYNCQTTTNYTNTDFTNATTTWNNVNANLDQYATDAHFGAEATYDYYFNTYGRNSIDNAGFALLNYVHYDVNYLNAFWDGTRMSYGDGSGSYTPLTSLDIAGHEITHGLTEHTCNLNYSNESGALNESFSDIGGVTIEHANNANWNWLLADNIGGAPFRSMKQPSLYGDPDAYGGPNWYVGTADNGGVHTNSGVQNHWYTILVDGDTATNFLNNSYSVAGQGFVKANAIAFRNQTVYLTPTSEYADSRFYSIQSAQDLYGGCSPEVQAVTDAWYAVNVGPAYVPYALANFSGSPNVTCTAPATVNFVNLGVNVNTWFWDFGDGTTNTTTYSPTHTYSSAGSYTVTLQIDGGTCGKDTLIIPNYIQINPQFSCVPMTNGTLPTQTGCTGLVYDDGGPSANYGNNITSIMTIAPTGASGLSLTFSSFNLEYNYDFLYIYDGPTTASTLIGTYTAAALPNNGNPIVASGNSLTLKFTSDGGLTYSGFSAMWQCTQIPAPPTAAFNGTLTSACGSNVQFSDLSAHQPTSWLWYFGDGTTSTLPNPLHSYTSNGTYTVKLVVSNTLGIDSLTQTNYITIAAPVAPIVNASNSTICSGDSSLLTVSSPVNGSFYNWFSSAVGGTSLGSGVTYNTGALSATTTLYTERNDTSSATHVGPLDNTIGTGNNYTTSNNRFLVFDCTTACILKSVKVISGATGNRTIELRDNAGTVIDSRVVNIPSGTQVVTLNMNLPVGTGFQLGLTPGGTGFNLYRNNAGASFPYTNGPVSITGVNPTSPQTYYYFFYDWQIQTLCTSPRTPTTITVNGVNPVMSASGAVTFCTGGNVTLSVPSATGASYQWYQGGVPTGTNSNTLVVNASGAFSCDISVGTCPTVTTNTITVTVNALPVASATAGGALTFCNGGSVLLTAGAGTGYTYQWLNNNLPIGGATASTYSANATGVYSVKVSTTGCGSDTSTTISVTEYPALTVNITPTGPFGSIDVCGSGNTVFTANVTGPAASSYVWKNSGTAIGGATSATYSTNATGNYSVDVVDVNNCTASSNVVVLTVNPQPVAAFSSSVVCCGGLVHFTDNSTGTGTGTTYLWKFGDGNTSAQPNPSHTYMTNGTFTVKEILHNGNCADSTTNNVTIDITGINEVQTNGFNLYPNPTSDNFVVQLAPGVIANHTILNLINTLGQKVMITDITSSKQTISVRGLAAGHYLVQIIAGNKIYSQQVVIQ